MDLSSSKPNLDKIHLTCSSVVDPASRINRQPILVSAGQAALACRRRLRCHFLAGRTVVGQGGPGDRTQPPGLRHRAGRSVPCLDRSACRAELEWACLSFAQSPLARRGPSPAWSSRVGSVCHRHCRGLARRPRRMDACGLIRTNIWLEGYLGVSLFGWPLLGMVVLGLLALPRDWSHRRDGWPDPDGRDRAPPPHGGDVRSGICHRVGPALGPESAFSLSSPSHCG